MEVRHLETSFDMAYGGAKWGNFYCRQRPQFGTLSRSSRTSPPFLKRESGERLDRGDYSCPRRIPFMNWPSPLVVPTNQTPFGRSWYGWDGWCGPRLLGADGRRLASRISVHQIRHPHRAGGDSPISPPTVLQFWRLEARQYKHPSRTPFLPANAGLQQQSIAQDRGNQ